MPDGKEVCHTCDNRPCVNPDHLQLGTRSSNMKDVVERGRFTEAQAWHANRAKGWPTQ